MRKKTLLIIVLLSLSATPALTQSDSPTGYSVQHFTDENGLPQNSINDLLFDNDGYLWLASQVGLVRFNGSSFKLYYPNDKPVMESNVMYLGKNDKGALYFQTDDHNLYHYPGNNRQFMDPVASTPAEALKRPYLLNGRKQLFDFAAFLNNAGSDAETQQRKKIFRYLFEHNLDFYVVDTSHLYFIYNTILYYYDSPKLTAVCPLTGGNGSLYLLQNKKFYVLNRDSLVAIYAAGQKVSGPPVIEGALRKEIVNINKAGGQFRIYSCGKTTHLLAGQRLYLLKPAANGGLQTEFLVNLDFIPNISAVEYNAGLDLLLVATDTEGFYFLRKNRFRIDGWSAPMRQKMAQHLFGPMVLRQGRRKDGEPWKEPKILTDRFIFTPAGKLISIADTAPIPQRCLYIDRKDQVWGAFFNLPRRMDTAMNPVGVLPALDAKVVDYTEDAAGHLYCLTEKSLWLLEAGGFRRLFTINQLSGREVFESFEPVGPHRLWIGGNSGLIEYDLEKKESRKFKELSGTHVRHIHACRDGNVLIGTYGQGYFYYYHERFIRMPLDKNGFLVTAHDFLEDRQGYIWIPCNKGLFKVPKEDMDAWCEGSNSALYYYYYGRQDGLLTNEFNGGFNSSSVITPEGFVALLSMKGMVCFYVDSLKMDFPHGSIDMTHLEIDGKSIDRTDTIRLQTGYNTMLMEISCPYLGNPNNLYLQYNVKGLSDEWRQVPADGIITLNRLASGEYRLRVRKVNGFGKNNYQYREWSVIMPPYFYRTTWFLLSLALALFVLLLLLVQLRLKLVEKKREIRVKAEKLRGAVVRLEETVAKLQQSEQELLRTNRQRERLISLVIHDLRSPLRFLTMLAGDLHDNQAILPASELKERTYWVKKGAQDIYNFSEDFLLWVTSQTDNFSISKRLFPVKPLLQEIYDFFLEQVQQKGNSISYFADEQLMIYSDPHVLITIIRNLADNANKYTHQGMIRLEAHGDGKDIVISVTDTGRGMTAQQVAAFLGNDDMDNVKSGSQLGHKFISDLTHRLDGTLTIESIEEKGTAVRLRFPAEGDRGRPDGSGAGG